MAETNTKLTPAELAALEQAFASDPASDAYLPLVEAYLAMGRFMEAMVVCKKGVRAHPQAPEGRVLLARVYAEQGKDRKALDELQGALEVAPDDASALCWAARLHLRGGERETGAEYLRRASAAAPGDEDVQAVADEFGIELAPPPAPEPELPPVVEPAPVEAAPPVLAPVATQPVATQPVAAPPVLAPAPESTPAAPPVLTPQPLAPAQVVKFTPKRTEPATFDASRWEEDDEPVIPAAAAARSRRGAMGFVATFAILSVALGGWFGLTRWQANRDREISRLLEETNDEIRKDTYGSYKAASEHAKQILDLDSDNFVAHAYLAYVNALRWGEQGEGDDFKRRATEDLEAARSAGEPHGRIIAAEALIKFFSGDAKGGEAAIQQVLAADTRSGLLYTTLGMIQMWSGDLDKAADSLRKAQNLEPNSVRVLSALGALHRRRGMDGDAWTFYDSALRIDKDHADSLLGKALLILDANEVERPKAEREKLLKEAETQIDNVLGLPQGAISARQLSLAKFARAQLLFAQGRRPEAEKLEQEAFTLDPSNPDVRLIRGRRLLREGDIDGAVAEIRQAIKIDEKRASFYVDLSKALLAKQGGAREAVASLQTALKTFPQSGRIHVLLGDAYVAVPDVDAARIAYEKAIEVEGGKLPEARAKLGAIWRKKGQHEKAREELEKSIKEFGLGSSGPNLALALTELGRIDEEGPEGDVKKAFERYAKAMGVSDSYAPPYFFLGRISAGQNDREQKKQAKDALETYLRLAPRGDHADEAKVLLARLR